MAERVYVLTILDINTDDREQAEIERQIFKAIDNGFVNGDVRETEQQTTIVTGYAEALAAYNQAVTAYDKLIARYGPNYGPAADVVAAEKALTEAALKLAADVRITHEG